VTGPTAWKKVHGSLKRVPGGFESALKRVQGSKGGYAQWEAEATKTVDAWLANGGGDGESSGGGRTTAVPYLFERGSRDGAREDSWAATGRLAEQVGFRRWAALNTLFFVSDRELRAAAPSLEIHGDEGFLLSTPTWDWGVARPSQECTFRVLSERWGILPGAVVVMSSQGALDGRYLVASVRDDLFSPESEVTLRRPVEPRPEPAHETVISEDTGTGSSPRRLTNGEGGGKNGTWKYGAGCPRTLNRKMKSFLDRAATFYDRTIVVTTTTNHSYLTSSGNVSDHNGGGAADFGSAANWGGVLDSPQGTRLAVAAHRACGTGYAEAKKRANTPNFENWPCPEGKVQILWKVEGPPRPCPHRNGVDDGSSRFT